MSAYESRQRIMGDVVCEGMAVCCGVLTRILQLVIVTLSMNNYTETNE